MATAAGIVMAPSRLMEEGGRAHFMTKRFDREGNSKHHLQTLCAMAQMDYRQIGTHDASQLFLLLRTLRLPYAAFEQAFRRIAFNVMAANCDDHPKNVSFLLREGGDWELSPAYDLTHAYNPRGQWTFQHLLGVNGKFAGITRQDLLDLADRFAIGTAPSIISEVGAAVADWLIYAKEAGLLSPQTERIAKHHHEL
jgi:serine/threonine-protein kinase HipA